MRGVRLDEIRVWQRVHTRLVVRLVIQIADELGVVHRVWYGVVAWERAEPCGAADFSDIKAVLQDLNYIY